MLCTKCGDKAVSLRRIGKKWFCCRCLGVEVERLNAALGKIAANPCECNGCCEGRTVDSCDEMKAIAIEALKGGG